MDQIQSKNIVNKKIFYVNFKNKRRNKIIGPTCTQLKFC